MSKAFRSTVNRPVADLGGRGPAGPTVQARVETLEQLLRGQLDDYRQLLECLQAKRASIRAADLAGIGEATRCEQRIVQRIAQREPTRRGLMQAITEAMAAGQSPLTVREIAERVDDPLRTRLTALVVELRAAASATRSESSIVRVAAETLSRHLGGVMQTMQSALGRAQVYGQRGRLATGAQVQFNVDLKS